MNRIWCDSPARTPEHSNLSGVLRDHWQDIVEITGDLGLGEALDDAVGSRDLGRFDLFDPIALQRCVPPIYGRQQIRVPGGRNLAGGASACILVRGKGKVRSR